MGEEGSIITFQQILRMVCEQLENDCMITLCRISKSYATQMSSGVISQVILHVERQVQQWGTVI
jgi:hypothetical protein